MPQFSVIKVSLRVASKEPMKDAIKEEFPDEHSIPFHRGAPPSPAPESLGINQYS